MRRARFAITAVFALNGAFFATFSARLPAIQHRSAISEGELGLGLRAALVLVVACPAAAAVLASAVRTPAAARSR